MGRTFNLKLFLKFILLEEHSDEIAKDFAVAIETGFFELVVWEIFENFSKIGAFLVLL